MKIIYQGGETSKLRWSDTKEGDFPGIGTVRIGSTGEDLDLAAIEAIAEGGAEIVVKSRLEFMNIVKSIGFLALKPYMDSIVFDDSD